MRELRVELHGEDRCAGDQQASREDPKPGPHLHHPIAGRELGGLHDRVERTSIGQEVLAQRALGAQPFGGQQATELAGRRRCQALSSQRRITAHRSSQGRARLGIASRVGPARSPARNRKPPAAPIMAPLSVHHAGGGTSSGRPSASRRRRSSERSAVLAATPPPSATAATGCSSAASAVFPANASTTASSKAAAKPSMGIASPRWRYPSTSRRTAVFRPEKLKS